MIAVSVVATSSDRKRKEQFYKKKESDKVSTSFQEVLNKAKEAIL